MNRPDTLLIVVLLAVLGWVCGRAESDQDDIKRLRDAGEIVPLQTIVDKLPERDRGQRLLEAELEFLEDGRYVYELKILGSDGTVRELQYDARTAALLRNNEDY